MSHAYRGDEVFFHKSGTPCVGKVLATGRHGCTVEHEGKQHKLKWEHLSGHKKRAPQNFKIVDHGEDGMIVENQDGHRRYLAIPPEARAEQLQVAQQKNKSPRNP